MMHSVNDYLKTVPFDLYELSLFNLVVKHRSFTKAAELAGITQSAITRQMQGMENSLAIDLLERTTRSVRVTPAGEFLYRESIRLLGDVDQSLQTLRQGYAGAKKVVRVAVSRSIGMAYLPGFFHANRRRLPEVGCQVSYLRSEAILTALEANEVDIGVLCPPTRLSRTLRVTHRFADAFTLIAPTEVAAGFEALPKSAKSRHDWVARQSWLQIDERTNTGQRLVNWTAKQGWRLEPAMQLDSFDLIINLVALGFGVSFVPIRALALYRNKRPLRRIVLPAHFERDLVVVVRKHRKPQPHVSDFVSNILF
jgi:DNA-binding transcriptional LysR family regulator